MFEVTHLTRAAYLVQPWKNELGQTLEIAVDSRTPYRWRVSQAPLTQSGPFSSFPSYDRSLCLWQGGPVSLNVDGKKRPLNLFSPLRFSGDASTDADVGNPGQDLGVLTHREKASAGLYVARFSPKEELQFPLAKQEHFIFCAEGKIEILEPNSQKTYLLQAHETLRVSRGSEKEYLNLRAVAEAGAVALWVVITLQPSD